MSKRKLSIFKFLLLIVLFIFFIYNSGHVIVMSFLKGHLYLIKVIIIVISSLVVLYLLLSGLFIFNNTIRYKQSKNNNNNNNNNNTELFINKYWPKFIKKLFIKIERD